MFNPSFSTSLSHIPFIYLGLKSGKDKRFVKPGLYLLKLLKSRFHVIGSSLILMRLRYAEVEAASRHCRCLSVA